jgi:hypothetical protein
MVCEGRGRMLFWNVAANEPLGQHGFIDRQLREPSLAEQGLPVGGHSKGFLRRSRGQTVRPSERAASNAASTEPKLEALRCAGASQ